MKSTGVSRSQAPSWVGLLEPWPHFMTWHMAMGQNPGPPVSKSPLFPTKIGSKMGGQFTYPKMRSHWFLNHAHICTQLARYNFMMSWGLLGDLLDWILARLDSPDCVSQPQANYGLSMFNSQVLSKRELGMGKSSPPSSAKSSYTGN